MARARWTHPVTSHREEVNQTFTTRGAAEAWLDLQRQTAATGVDHGQTLSALCRAVWVTGGRGLSIRRRRDPYLAGLRLRVLPTLGHLPVALISAGLVDRAIDVWEQQYCRSTVKNTVAALVLVLDEAVRDGIMRPQPGEGPGPPYAWVGPRRSPGSTTRATSRCRTWRPSSARLSRRDRGRRGTSATATW